MSQITQQDVNVLNPDKFKTYLDDRGVIQEICKHSDVLRITSKRGSRRAAHFHKTSSHYCVVLQGSISYWERTVGSNDKPEKKVYYAGDIFYTGPMIEHLMVFEYDNFTEFYCFSLNGDRSQENYEADLVRLDFDLDKI